MIKRKNLLHLVVLAILLFTYFESLQNKKTTSLIAVVSSAMPAVQFTPSPTAVLGASISAETASNSVQVTKVVDGDTIKVLLNGTTETIRIIGIDTPETVDPRKPVQCFGKQASDETKHLAEGKMVNLVPDPTQENRDKYKRLLRYVYLEDGSDLGQLLISEGFAHEYTYKVPYQHQAKYKEDQKSAELAKRGLWADGVCVSPSPGLLP